MPDYATLYINDMPHEAAVGKTLLEALSSCGVNISAPCSGNGKCGKCRVEASGELSPMSAQERKLLGGAADTFRLACMTRIEGNARVRIAKSTADIMTAAKIAEFELSPTAYQSLVTIPLPTTSKPTPADERLKSALCGVAVTETAASQLAELQADGLESVYVTVASGVAVSVTAAPRRLYGLAVDVGTTTVAAYLVDFENAGVKPSVFAFENPQRFAGADVISRIEYCTSEGSAHKLADVIVKGVNEAAVSLCRDTGIETTDIVAAAIAGNTVMEHIFAAIMPKSIAAAPFAPVTLFGGSRKASSLGLCFDSEALVALMPCVASYVGGDITAGAAAAGLYGKKGSYVYIDVGTNGEIAVCRDGKFTFAATAAGPAFEGAHIKYGMSALDGAIRAVSFDDGKLSLDVVGKTEAKGICGSGLIDATVAFLDAELIDETGRIADADDVDDEYKGFIDEDDEVLKLTDKVALTGQDIREIQLAKAAIAAGINTLLDDAGIDAADLDAIILAGGFGSNINAKSACRIGLLPRDMARKVSAVGNTAGAGAVSWLLSGTAREQIAAIAKESAYLELSGNAFFMDDYIDQMMFE